MELAIVIVTGLTIGSFLNVCIARLPHGASVVAPRSRCPQCLKPISGYDNIPVISFLLLRGKCRRCGKAIALRYPAVELLTGAVSALVFMKYGLTVSWGLHFAFSSALIVLAFIDAEHRILPDPITLNGIWLGLLANVVLAVPSPLITWLLGAVGAGDVNPRVNALLSGVLGAIVGAGFLWVVAEIYFRIRGIEGMGFGDVKMMAMVGAFLGAPLALFTIMAGSLMGSIIGLAIMYFAGKSRDYEHSFGTYLGFAAIAADLYGDPAIQYYVDHLIRPGL